MESLGRFILIAVFCLDVKDCFCLVKIEMRLLSDKYKEQSICLSKLQNNFYEIVEDCDSSLFRRSYTKV